MTAYNYVKCKKCGGMKTEVEEDEFEQSDKLNTFHKDLDRQCDCK